MRREKSVVVAWQAALLVGSKQQLALVATSAVQPIEQLELASKARE